IKGILKPWDHVITSSMEHNSVTRPLAKLTQQGVEVTKLPGNSYGWLDPKEVAEGIKENTKLIVLSHASNVTGLIQPIEEIGKLARQKGILFMVDSAQTAGSFEIDVDNMNIDLLVFAGHKGLLGPQGTGGLYIRPDLQLDTLKEGGTGSNSESPLQPEESPERYESGTLNTPGLAGLGKGVEYILEVGLEKIREKEKKLTLELMKGIMEIPGTKIYGLGLKVERAPVVSFNIEGKEPSQLAYLLDQVYEIASRPGLHCAPDAHRILGTFPYGALRLSPSYFNTSQEIEKCLVAISELV
ncbi:MAG: aminotransferase class V-fold PLP-dependent enzyme, partial [Desulfitobacterium sp.]|nr:aminotransferase class V-fold PLP-dependent enzyme [Desulfitobacterium sp.]